MSNWQTSGENKYVKMIKVSRSVSKVPKLLERLGPRHRVRHVEQTVFVCGYQWLRSEGKGCGAYKLGVREREVKWESWGVF